MMESSEQVEEPEIKNREIKNGQKKNKVLNTSFRKKKL